MAKDSPAPKKASDKPAAPQAPRAPQAVVAPGSERCKSEECKHKPQKFGFCMEHYDLYMEGIIRGDGRKPSDYAEKMARHLSRKSQRKVA